MTAHWLSRIGLFTGILSVGLLSGCVERRYTVLTDPPMAMVLENGTQIGPAPVNRQFVYYGIYRLTLQRDGYQTLVVDQDIPAPWWEYPPFDFFVENILPFTLRDIHVFTYTLQPPVFPSEEQIKNRAIQVQGKAAPLYVPLPPPVTPPPQVPPQQMLAPQAPAPQNVIPEGPPPQKLVPEGPPPRVLLPPS